METMSVAELVRAYASNKPRMAIARHLANLSPQEVLDFVIRSRMIEEKQIQDIRQLQQHVAHVTSEQVDNFKAEEKVQLPPSHPQSAQHLDFFAVSRLLRESARQFQRKYGEPIRIICYRPSTGKIAVAVQVIPDGRSVPSTHNIESWTYEDRLAGTYGPGSIAVELEDALGYWVQTCMAADLYMAKD